MIKDNGYILNSSGGEIKGSQNDLLEQSSTMADKMEVTFESGSESVPSCYYEFAKRYARPKWKSISRIRSKSPIKYLKVQINKC